jgi:hypothetical protein
MSEFDCHNHCGPWSSHQIRNGRCPICHDRITTMDGLTERQLRGMEREAELKEEEGEE